MNEQEREQLGITAALLAQGRLVHGASMLVTAIGLLVTTFGSARPLAFAAVLLVLFLAELYLAVRVSFDARLFDRLAAASTSSVQFDEAMRTLRLLPESKIGHDWTTRCRGARRLLLAQGLVVAAQCATIGVQIAVSG